MVDSQRRVPAGCVVSSWPESSDAAYVVKNLFFGLENQHPTLEEQSPAHPRRDTPVAQEKVSSRCDPSGDGSPLLAAARGLSKAIRQNAPDLRADR